MLHAYDAGKWRTSTKSYDNGTGEELFAYVPNILLDDLNKMKVTSDSGHPSLVDGCPTAADVWLDENRDNAMLSFGVKTVLISGLRRGAGASLLLMSPAAQRFHSRLVAGRPNRCTEAAFGDHQCRHSGSRVYLVETGRPARSY